MMDLFAESGQVLHRGVQTIASDHNARSCDVSDALDTLKYYSVGFLSGSTS